MKNYINMSYLDLQDRHKWTRGAAIFWLAFMVLMVTVDIFVLRVPVSAMIGIAVLSVSFTVWTAVEKVLLYIKSIRRKADAKERKNAARRAKRAAARRSRR